MAWRGRNTYTPLTRARRLRRGKIGYPNESIIIGSVSK
jgi:hypothetical protein